LLFLIPLRQFDQAQSFQAEPSDEESELKLITRLLRDMEALGLFNLGQQSEREHDAKEAA